MPVVCVVCHDPHAEHTYTNVLNGVYTFTNLLTGDGIVISNTQLGAVYTNQLRNPLASTNDYFVTRWDVRQPIQSEHQPLRPMP